MDFFTFLILVIALLQVEKLVRYLYTAGPPLKTLLPAQFVTKNLLSFVEPVLSDNYVASTNEEQKMLLELECILKLTPKQSTQFPKLTSTNHKTFLPATNIDESFMHLISNVIACSAGLVNSAALCDGVENLYDNMLFGLKSRKYLIFGFRLRLEETPMSAAMLRIKLHHMAKRYLKIILREVTRPNYEEREIVFVGYETGGSLATLAAWHAIKELSVDRKLNSAADLLVSNNDNRIKVVTWDEVPLFTKATASESPILPHNHLRFSTFACPESNFIQLAKSSGGINDINYYSTSGEVFNIFPNVYNDFTNRVKPSDWDSRRALTSYVSKKNFDKLDEFRVQKLVNIIELHRKHVLILYELIQNQHKEFIKATLLAEPKACAASLANHLSTNVFPKSTISCRVDSYSPAEGEFKLYCSYENENKKTSQFLSFDAKLGDDSAFNSNNNCLPFMRDFYQLDEELIDVKEEYTRNKRNKRKAGTAASAEDSDSAKKPRKLVKKYVGPELATDNWARCLFSLLNQTPAQSIVSPFAVVNENFIRAQCSYVSFQKLVPNSTNTGCYLRAPNIAQELSQLYRSDAAFFYRTVDSKTMEFPTECIGKLFQLSFTAKERPGLENLQQLATNYLTELFSDDPLAKKMVNFWRPKDTFSFKTLDYFGKTTMSNTTLSDSSHYAPEFRNILLKCLSNESYPYRDCTDPLSRWIPMACPAACKDSSGAVDFLCKQVKNCPLAGYYIALSREGTVEQLSNAQSKMTQLPQFGMFRIQKKSSSYSLYSDIFNLAFFRIPQLPQ